MKPEDVTDTILSQLKQLEEKYSQTGQSLTANLEGLLHTNYLKYWDYIRVDTLLTLQNPKTAIPDEMVFILYHQITELYFKLILWEIQQIADNMSLTTDFFIQRVGRINRYIQALINSFDIMLDGMDPVQFKQFRMALLPASGFQSAQYRMIEICLTDLHNLVEVDYRESMQAITPLEHIYEHIYWKKGATESHTGKETITLKHFQEKYSETFIRLAYQYQHKNVWQKYLHIDTKDENLKELREKLRELDLLFNVHWRFSHLRSAGRYLKEGSKEVAATGGTNWVKYLPPKTQRITFFPTLWSEEERKGWGNIKEVKS